MSDARIIKTDQGLQLSGDFIFANMSFLLKELGILLETQHSRKLSLLCNEISRIDSAGIAFLIEMKRWCSRHNMTLSIHDLPDQAQSLIETYKLQDVL